MKRKPIKKVSNRQKIILACEKILGQILKFERGNKCEFSGRTKGVGQFHILPKSTAPRLRFHKENILLVAWFPYHHDWHHDYEKAKEIEKKIIKLRGKDYKERLKILEKLAPKLTDFYLNNLHFALKTELENKEFGKK